MSDAVQVLRQVRFTNRAFWRNPANAFFTFAFPLMFLVIFTGLFGNDEQCSLGPGLCPPGEIISTSTFYVAAIATFSISPPLTRTWRSTSRSRETRES